MSLKGQTSKGIIPAKHNPGGSQRGQASSPTHAARLTGNEDDQRGAALPIGTSLVKCPLKNLRSTLSLAEKCLQGPSVNMSRNGEQSTVGPHTATHLATVEAREARSASARFSAEPAAGLPSSPCPTGEDPRTLSLWKPGEGRLGREMWKPLSHKPTVPIPVGGREEESSGFWEIKTSR